jgi:hypothetical protein
MDAYSDGMMIHIKKYNNIPGTPPGASAIKNARRNQKALIPKNSPSPPQTPAMTRLLMDLRSPFLFFMQHLSYHNEPVYISLKYTQASIKSCITFEIAQGPLSADWNGSLHHPIAGFVQ